MESATMVYIVESPQRGLVRNETLETIQEHGKRGLGVCELSGVRGADMFFILKTLKQLSRADLISARVMQCTGAIRSRGWHSG